MIIQVERMLTTSSHFYSMIKKVMRSRSGLRAQGDQYYRPLNVLSSPKIARLLAKQSTKLCMCLLILLLLMLLLLLTVLIFVLLVLLAVLLGDSLGWHVVWRKRHLTARYRASFWYYSKCAEKPNSVCLLVFTTISCTQSTDVRKFIFKEHHYFTAL